MMRLAIAMAAVMTVAAPGMAQETRDCARAADPQWCRAMQGSFREALQRPRDYTAMRNVALCLWDGCDGAVAINRAASCRIRRQIMDTHRTRVDRSDETHFANCVAAGH